MQSDPLLSTCHPWSFFHSVRRILLFGLHHILGNVFKWHSWLVEAWGVVYVTELHEAKCLLKTIYDPGFLFLEILFSFLRHDRVTGRDKRWGSFKIVWLLLKLINFSRPYQFLDQVLEDSRSTGYMDIKQQFLTPQKNTLQSFKMDSLIKLSEFHFFLFKGHFKVD